MMKKRSTREGLGLVFLVLMTGASALEAQDSRGLWVGQVTLDAVTEVSVPFDENNIPIGPDPQTPTRTFDQAHLRLIVHVNGAGQVRLLKDVAVLSRIAPDAAGFVAAESDLDLALVTDEALFSEFPPQPAKRFASVAFDFGDEESIRALDAIVAVAVEAAVKSVNGTSQDLSTEAGRAAAASAAESAALDSLAEPNGDSPSLESIADQAASFNNFIRNVFDRDVVSDLAEGMPLPTEVRDEAQRLAGGVTATNVRGDLVTFLQDGRAEAMIAAVEDAIAAAEAGREEIEAQNAAADFADLDDAYGRFLAGGAFPIAENGGTIREGNLMTLIREAAVAGAVAKIASGDIEEAIKGGAGGSPPPLRALEAAEAEAVDIQVSLYDDTRASEAVDVIVAAIIAAAEAADGSAGLAELEAELIDAALKVLRSPVAEGGVRPSLVSAENPTADYTSFVRDGDEFTTLEKFSEAGAKAAAAASEGAVSDARSPLSDLDSIRRAATLAARDALSNHYGAAARVVRTFQPMSGSLSPGTVAMGMIMLPASHPTNPFRHRRHPDHSVGFDIERRITFRAHGDPEDDLERAGFGVDRLTGIYEEEIFGLHKPLGPDKDTGLKVSGIFELNRISRIDALNAE